MRGGATQTVHLLISIIFANEAAAMNCDIKASCLPLFESLLNSLLPLHRPTTFFLSAKATVSHSHSKTLLFIRTRHTQTNKTSPLSFLFTLLVHKRDIESQKGKRGKKLKRKTKHK